MLDDNDQYCKASLTMIILFLTHPEQVNITQDTAVIWSSQWIVSIAWYSQSIPNVCLKAVIPTVSRPRPNKFPSIIVQVQPVHRVYNNAQICGELSVMYVCISLTAAPPPAPTDRRGG